MRMLVVCTVSLMEWDAALKGDKDSEACAVCSTVLSIKWPILAKSKQTVIRVCRQKAGLSCRLLLDGPDAIPATIAHVIGKLPPALEPDQPVPDVECVVDHIMNFEETRSKEKDLSAHDTAKRAQESTGDAPAATDLFHIRQRMKVESFA